MKIHCSTSSIVSWTIVAKFRLDYGFTLIELLMVMTILGILTALSLPNFLAQVGKAREAEVKGVLGTIGRAQQGYHFERKHFATTVSLLNDGQGQGGFNSKYAIFPNPSDASGSRVRHQALAIDGGSTRVRNFAVGIYYSAGEFDQVFCESFDIDETVNAGNTASDDCTNSGRRLD